MTNRQLIKDLPINYDVLEDEVLVKNPNGEEVKTILGQKIKEFTLNTDGKMRKFINGRTMKSESIPFVGFFEVLEEGSLNLYAKPEVEITKSNYNELLNSGSKSDKILVREKFYFGTNGNVQKLQRKKTAFYQIFFPFGKEMENYVKSSKLKTNSKENLVTIFKYFNSL